MPFVNRYPFHIRDTEWGHVPIKCRPLAQNSVDLIQDKATCAAASRVNILRSVRRLF